MITPSQLQILEAVLEALPPDFERFGKDEWELGSDMVEGYNKALDDVRAIINEFLEPEGKS